MGMCRILLLYSKCFFSYEFLNEKKTHLSLRIQAAGFYTSRESNRGFNTNVFQKILDVNCKGCEFWVSWYGMVVVPRVFVQKPSAVICSQFLS